MTDVFDTNQYAHDPRNDFLNWAAGGCRHVRLCRRCVGIHRRRRRGVVSGSLGLGAVGGSISPMSRTVPIWTPVVTSFRLVEEMEKRYSTVSKSSGRILITVFDSRGRMGLLDEAVQHAQATGEPVDIAAVRRYRSRLGVSLDVEQQLSRTTRPIRADRQGRRQRRDLRVFRHRSHRIGGSFDKGLGVASGAGHASVWQPSSMGFRLSASST